jgi:flagellin
MPIGILNNIPSLAAENELTLTSTALNQTLEQLSSGSRINTGADDPAGLAISNGLQANIAALTQSVSNANDGVGELQLADGALAQVTNLLDTAVTLATESATGTVSDSQRTAIQAQYASILAEINRIGTATTYNGQAVFQGGVSPNLNEQDAPATTSLSPTTGLTVGDATTISAGGATFTYTAGVSSLSGTNTAGVTGATTLTASTAITITHGSGSTTFTTGAGGTDTVQDLINAINGETGTANIGQITVTGSPVTGLSAALTGTGNHTLQITDNSGAGNLAASAGLATALGAGGAVASNDSTVQDLINAVNSSSDPTGVQAALVGGVLEILDPLSRADIAVTTTDTVLGATASGTPTSFITPNTNATSSTDKNRLQGSATTLTATTSLGAAGSTYTFTAGTKTFTFTAAATGGSGAGGVTDVADLISAINDPSTDSAGLSAYISNGQFFVVDPNNNGNLAFSPSSTGTALGSFTNSLQTGSSSENIFLSDSTGIGSSQIAVNIGSLSTSAITNGSGGQAVNLTDTDLDTQTDAQDALTAINQAISNIASTRGTLGASVNRLTAASNVINAQVQNLTSAENTITAADIPTAVANLTKYSILEQTGISALAQANQQQQLVLKLLQ